MRYRTYPTNEPLRVVHGKQIIILLSRVFEIQLTKLTFNTYTPLVSTRHMIVKVWDIRKPKSIENENEISRGSSETDCERIAAWARRALSACTTSVTRLFWMVFKYLEYFRSKTFATCKLRLGCQLWADILLSCRWGRPPVQSSSKLPATARLSEINSCRFLSERKLRVRKTPISRFCSSCQLWEVSWADKHLAHRIPTTSWQLSSQFFSFQLASLL